RVKILGHCAHDSSSLSTAPRKPTSETAHRESQYFETACVSSRRVLLTLIGWDFLRRGRNGPDTCRSSRHDSLDLLILAVKRTRNSKTLQTGEHSYMVRSWMHSETS